MSKSRFNPLITASVISAVYLAGLSNVSQAVVPTTTSDSLTSMAVELHQDNQSVLPAANAEGQRRYIIQFNEQPVARYNGTGSFSAIPRRADNKIEVNSPAVNAYVTHLKKQQQNFLSTVSTDLGRSVKQNFSYQYAINGVVLELTASEASQLARNPDVKSIAADREYELTTDVGPQLIGADNVWLGNVPAVGSAFGEGVVFGILDSGANFDHPSFADVGGDGFDHNNPLGSGNYLGVCDPTNTEQFLGTYTCNDKIIGGYDFVNAITPDGGFDIPGPEDENGHGTHTASTAGGNVVNDVEFNGITGISISGVAPHANVIPFDTCYNPAPGAGGGCFGSSAVASIDQILADGIVDVVNYSISGGTSPWTDAVSLAFLSATDSGVFISASAGNSGPGPATLGHVEPWTSSVGASTHNRRFSNALTVTGPDPVPLELVDVFTVQGTGPEMVVDLVGTMEYSGNVDAANVEGCVAFPPSSFDGLVAVISRGACSFATKVNNASAAGAIGVVVHNNVAGGPIVMGGLGATTIPSVMVTLDTGLDLDSFIDANPGVATVSVAAASSVDLGGLADSMAAFSSRGPSAFEYNKPDVTGPGVNILAGFADTDPGTGTPAEYGAISGTSMSSPHNAGTAALLKELHPSWSAAEIKSALMLTAVTAGVTKEDGVTPADPFDRGAGRIQVDVASSTGLVMNETAFRFLLADPAEGGDPKTLNVASYKNDNCEGTCTFERTFRSVASTTVTYDAAVTGLTGTVNPANFTVVPGQEVTLEVTIDGSASPIGETSFGELVLTPNVAVKFGGVQASPELHLPLVVTAFPDQPIIAVNPESINETLETDTNIDVTLNISNDGLIADLNWDIIETGTVDNFTINQANLPGNEFINGFLTFGSGIYPAESFSVAQVGLIEKVSINGVSNGNAGLLSDASQVTVQVYADAGGQPAGHPEDGLNSALFELTLPVGDANLDLDGNSGFVGIDVLGATGSAIELPAGNYWVLVFPTMLNNNFYFWNAGVDVSPGSPYRIDPGALLGGSSDWQVIDTLDGLALTMSNELTCGASWLSASITTDVTGPGADVDVTINLDATGLAEGVYSAAICIGNDDFDNSLVSVPVTMTVTPSDIIFANGFEAAP